MKLSWTSIVNALTALPKSRLFNNEGTHLWGSALWTYFFLMWARPAHAWLVLALAVALASAHEFWYDAMLPGAPPMGALDSPYPGRLENWSGYVAGIALAALLWYVPVAGVSAFWFFVAVILVTAIVQTIHKRA